MRDLQRGDRIAIRFEGSARVPEEAVIEGTYADAQEGLGPEIEDYIASWLEIRMVGTPSSKSPTMISLGIDGLYSLDGNKINITKL